MGALGAQRSPNVPVVSACLGVLCKWATAPLGLPTLAVIRTRAGCQEVLVGKGAGEGEWGHEMKGERAQPGHPGRPGLDQVYPSLATGPYGKQSHMVPNPRWMGG